MKKQYFCAIMCALILVVLLGGQPISGAGPVYTYLNKDVHNMSNADAYDLTVILRGAVTVDWHFDGYSDGNHFGQFDTSTFEEYTLKWTKLRWSQPKDGNGMPKPIHHCDTVHVGWSVDKPAAIEDMYWTDAQGNPLPFSFVHNLTTGWKYLYIDGRATITLGNYLTPPAEIPQRNILASDVRYGTFSTAIDPNYLNPRNLWLNSQLQPINQGPFEICFHCSTSVQLPGTFTEGTWIVLYFINSAPAVGGTDSTDCRDYIMWKIDRTTSQIPTLTEWGLIIFGVLLVGFMSWAFIRRRRKLTVGI